MRHRLLGLVLVSSLGCGGGDDDSGSAADARPSGDGAMVDAGQRPGSPDSGPVGSDAALGSFPHRLIRPSCAPHDGPAVRILLGSMADGDRCGIDAGQPSVSIDVWTREIQAPVTFTFAPGEAMGGAMVCPGLDGLCRAMPAGAVTFEEFVDGQGATGSWVVYEDQQQMSGAFDATWCEPATPEPCG